MTIKKIIEVWKLITNAEKFVVGGFFLALLLVTDIKTFLALLLFAVIFVVFNIIEEVIK